MGTRLGLYGGSRPDYSGFIAPAPAGLNYYRVTRQLPTSGAIDVVDGIGFSPTCCKVTVGVADSAETVVLHNYIGIGVSDGTNEWAVGFGDDDNQSPPDTWRHQSDGHVIYYGNKVASAKCSAVGAGYGPGLGKWSFIWSDFPGSDWYAIYEFWDCEAHVGTVNLGTGTSPVDCSTGSVDPNVAFVFGVCSPSTPQQNTDDDAILTYGVASNTTGSVVQRGICYSSNDQGDGSASVVNFIGYDDAVGGKALDDSEVYEMDVNSFGTGKFQITPSASTSSEYVGWLALDVGNSKTYLGTLTLPTSTSLWDVNDIGFEPGQVDLFSGLITSGDVNTLQTSGDAAEVFYFGNTDGSTAGSLCWISEDDDGGFTDTKNTASTAFLYVIDDAEAVQYNIGTPTFDSGGFTVTPGTADGTSHVAFVFALETGEGTAGLAHPVYPFGHPLFGPFAGPIGH